MIALFIIIIAWAVLMQFTLKQMIFKGKYEYAIFFLMLFLPFYTTILSLTYQVTGSPLAVNFFQFQKEIIVLLGLVGFVAYQKNLNDYPWRLHIVDKLFLAFVGLSFLFMLLPLGEASFVNRALYFKNLLIPGIVYFIGRNCNFSQEDYKKFFTIVFFIAISAFFVNVFETAIDTHLQSLTGYARYMLDIQDIEASGHFGLTWTFETSAVTKRLASFFSDPLELASSILLGFSAGLIFFLTSDRKDWLLPTIVMFTSFASLLFAASRAAFLAFFVMIFFIALVFKLYKLILTGAAGLVAFVIYVLFFASEDFYYFVVDTLTFQSTSSVGHVIEWVLALDSMIAHPLGIGLGMSGNVGAVDEELRVGGENQFLIYGVQLGWLGMILYILMLYYAVRVSLRVFRQSENVMVARIGFVAAAVKVGMLLPLFTANAEVYAYVAWTSWWMVGHSVMAYQKIAYPKLALS
ncbi:O-antigen ligase family protein [Litoribacter ruber]|uniref:O-antigen ligase family protein n=1 Tax=Litoribacter ruber TaxID=702568 RepID=UPI001FE47A5F|nr:O-antigen ligase family protein [Litoribacter ruber]